MSQNVGAFYALFNALFYMPFSMDNLRVVKDDVGRAPPVRQRERESHEIQTQQSTTGFFQALKTPANGRAHVGGDESAVQPDPDRDW